MEEQDLELEAMRSPSVPGALDYAALAAALLPFVISLRSSETSSAEMTVVSPDGQEITTQSESSSFRDTAAIVGGASAIVIALVLLVQTPKVAKAKRGLRLGIVGVCFLLGIYQLTVRSGLLS